jgi:hypothetical protein
LTLSAWPMGRDSTAGAKMTATPLALSTPSKMNSMSLRPKKSGAFSFTDTGGSVRDINLAVGAVSHRSVHAAGNDP